MAHRVTFIPGDGSGPELTEATRRVLEATGVAFDWQVHEAGLDAFEATGDPFPAATLASLRDTRVGLKGPTTTPSGSGFRSINVLLRKELDLYACVRPCKAYPGVRTRFPETDVVIIRENTEDVYAGIEFEAGSPGAQELAALVARDTGATLRPDAGISIKPISEYGSERIVRAAFEYARQNGRRQVHAAHKANIMKRSDGVFLRVAREVAADYPDIAFADIIVDNLCNQLVSWPGEYDVIVLPNLYGDLLSDLCAGLVGGLGVAPGANIGTHAAVFEATHGSAPTLAGQDKLNPTAVMLSAVLMLRHLGEVDAATRMEAAIASVIAAGDRVTFDLKPTKDDPTAVGTAAFADAVIEAL